LTSSIPDSILTRGSGERILSALAQASSFPPLPPQSGGPYAHPTAQQNELPLLPLPARRGRARWGRIPRLPSSHFAEQSHPPPCLQRRTRRTISTHITLSQHHLHRLCKTNPPARCEPRLPNKTNSLHPLSRYAGGGQGGGDLRLYSCTGLLQNKAKRPARPTKRTPLSRISLLHKRLRQYCMTTGVCCLPATPPAT
jgi:hypothetical protein